MAEWTVTEEAVAALEQMATQLKSLSEQMEAETQKLKHVFDENQDGLGYHSAKIRILLEEVEETEESARRPVRKLVLKLTKASAIRKAHIEKGYSAGNSKGVSGGQRAPETSSKPEKIAASGPASANLDSPEYIAHVLHELDALQESLDLTEGDPGVLQLGGYHGDVKRDAEKKSSGFESHHIPSQGALEDDPDHLPTIAISREDHALTDSYAGKQRKRYISIFPDVPPSDAYKAGVIREIAEGKFAEIVRDEIYNIREKCGTKYDGGIAQYFEALKRYIEKNGVPKAKR